MLIVFNRQRDLRGSLQGILAVVFLLVLCMFISGGHLLLQENNMNLGEKIKVREKEISKIEERLNIVKGELSNLQSQPNMEMRVNTIGLDLTLINVTQVVRLKEPSSVYGFIPETNK